MLPKCNVCGSYIDTLYHQCAAGKYETRWWREKSGGWLLEVKDKTPFCDSQEDNYIGMVYGQEDVEAVRGEAFLMLEWADEAEVAIADGKVP